jgi:GT2 family glycosyltransferase
MHVAVLLFVSANLIKNIGLFDERFFLTFEETDLCYRAKKAGFKSYFVPSAKVWHKISSSFGGERSALFNYFLMRNKLLWAEKHLPYLKRLLLYKNVLHQLLTSMIPPRVRIYLSRNISLIEKIMRSLSADKPAFVEKLDSPVRKARLLGARDYILRRFGNSSESIRSISERI